MGEQLRIIRLEKNITINALAETTGFTPSFISQFERGLTKGSLGTIHKITNALGITVSSLFAEIENNKKDKISVIRKEDRPRIFYPDGQTVDYVLSNSSEKLKSFYTEIVPHGESGEAYSSFNKVESLSLLEGKLEITFGDKNYILKPGDTITYPSNEPRTWKNLSKETTKVFWFFIS